MLSAIPAQLRAGDTWKWSFFHVEYSAADGWILTTNFRGASSLDVVAASDGSSWISTVAATATDDVSAGRYSWASKVSKDSEVFTVASGIVEVLAMQSAVVAGADGRTMAEIHLDTINAALSSLLAKRNASVSFGDQSFTLQNIEVLHRLRDRYRQEVAAEKALANGGRSRTIKIHFPSC